MDDEFDTGGRSRISINCLFGGWGRSTGVAYYDDVRLELDGQALKALLAEMPDLAEKVAEAVEGRTSISA